MDSKGANTPETSNSLGTLFLHENEMSEWHENRKLCLILYHIKRGHLLQQFLNSQVTDLWLPIPKRVVQRILEEQDRKPFLDAQEEYLRDEMPSYLDGQHLSLMDSDSMGLEEVRPLGSGGYGEVHHVIHPQTGREYARKVMKRPMGFNNHCEFMKRFKKELSGMRRVEHHHLVKLTAACTDTEKVMLLSLPVADMDLSTFLDLDLDKNQRDILHKAVGCITSALTYLHQLNIRRAFPR